MLQAPIADFFSSAEAAHTLGISQKLVEAACSAYRHRLESHLATVAAAGQERAARWEVDPEPLPHELACIWIGKRPTYLVYRPLVSRLRINRAGDHPGRRGRRAGWHKAAAGDGG